MQSNDSPSRLSRRQALKQTGRAMAGVMGLAAAASLPGCASGSGESPLPQPATAGAPPRAERPADKLRIATCQFPVGANPAENAAHIRQYMRQAADGGAHLLHTSEAALSGYGGTDVPSFAQYDWTALRRETANLRQLARDLHLWLVLGSAHFLDDHTKPANCVYLIAPDGAIADRYDKCFCTVRDQRYYSVGSRLVTRDIQGVRIGLAICFDACWPQLYIAYRNLGATVMVHSFYNANDTGWSCLDVSMLALIPARCSDNRMWAVCNNSSRFYSHWASFIARPDATIPKQLVRNEPGILIHDFPDGLSERGSYHNFKPMQKPADEIMSWGNPVQHPRQADGQSEP
jgi:predicted amidohydrolase